MKMETRPKTGKRRGDVKVYGAAKQRQAMMLSATGLTDQQVADALQIRRRQTVCAWRRKNRAAWDKAKQDVMERAAFEAVKKTGEQLGDVIARQLETVRDVQARLIQDLENEGLEANSPEAVAHALLKALDVERELCGGVRETHGHLMAPATKDELLVRIRQRFDEMKQIDDGNEN